MAKKTTSPEMLQNHWENMHFRLGQKNYLLEILRLGENPYKTLGNQWFPATETWTAIEPLVCTKEITLGAPCENVGFPWFS